MVQFNIFAYDNDSKIRTIEINGEVWWVAKDVCIALGLNPNNINRIVERVDEEDKKIFPLEDSLGRRQDAWLVNEAGLYNMIFESRKPDAKKFKKWVTSEVLPKIRKTGAYAVSGRAPMPAFLRRAAENWERIESGYFSVIGQLATIVYSKLELNGYVVPDRGEKGKEIRPDISVGRMFASWLEKNHPSEANDYKPYKHKLPDGSEVDARQYKNSLLERFIWYVENIWIKERAYEYFAERDPKAINYLPKLIPGLQNKSSITGQGNPRLLGKV